MTAPVQGAAHSDSDGSVSGSVVAEHPDTSAVQGVDVNCALADAEVGDGASSAAACQPQQAGYTAAQISEE